MQIDGALISEQGVDFGIVIVKKSAMISDCAASETRVAFQGLFPGVPLILASQDAWGTFEFHGRRDIVDFLAAVNPARIPWRRYSVG